MHADAYHLAGQQTVKNTNVPPPSSEPPPTPSVSSGRRPDPQRHPAIEDALSYFRYDHLTGDAQKDVACKFAEFAYQLAASLPNCPQLTAGLHKLLEAKDCMVRASLAKK